MPDTGPSRVPLRPNRLIMPVFFAASVILWMLAPDPVLGALTPVVGTLAVICAGLNLARVTWIVYGFSRRHRTALQRLAGPDWRQLNRSMGLMVLVLLATTAMAAGFYVMATTLLEQPANMASQSRVLWLLTAGGLALAVAFGELVTHLVAVVDHTLKTLSAPAD